MHYVAHKLTLEAQYEIYKVRQEVDQQRYSACDIDIPTWLQHNTSIQTQDCNKMYKLKTDECIKFSFSNSMYRHNRAIHLQSGCTLVESDVKELMRMIEEGFDSYKKEDKKKEIEKEIKEAQDKLTVAQRKLRDLK